MNVKQFIVDLHELVPVVRAKLGKPQVAIFGHTGPRAPRASARDAGLLLSRARRSLGPPETSVAYFNALTAPSKRFVWFDESGHEPFVDEPATFDASMVELVRPVLE